MSIQSVMNVIKISRERFPCYGCAICPFYLNSIKVTLKLLVILQRCLVSCGGMNDELERIYKESVAV